MNHKKLLIVFGILIILSLNGVRPVNADVDSEAPPEEQEKQQEQEQKQTSETPDNEQEQEKETPEEETQTPEEENNIETPEESEISNQPEQEQEKETPDNTNNIVEIPEDDKDKPIIDQSDHWKNKKDDPCVYNNQNICGKNGKCDDVKFDCVTPCKDKRAGDVTGRCPGDDGDDHPERCFWWMKNCDGHKHRHCFNWNWWCHEFKRHHDGDHKDTNSKSGTNSNNNDNVKGFKVKVVLDNAKSDIYQVRVIVYGPHTLNKPTLDKPGETVHCNTTKCDAGTFAFTSTKVPIGSEIKVCAMSDHGEQSCEKDVSHFRYGIETIKVNIK